MPYYPDQTLILGMTTIRRERKLPPNAIGEALVKVNSIVDPATVVLRGAVPGKFIILDALKLLGLKSADQITGEMWQASEGEILAAGDVILAGRRGRKVTAPMQSVFVRYENGQVILQADPVPLEVLALTPGMVTSVRDERLVIIETTGALVQGAWGNGKAVYAALTLEPEGGIESLQTDEIIQDHAGAALVMRGPITSPAVFAIALQQTITAIIAPSMRSSLRELALRQPIPILLTEGFGEQEMSEIVYNLLRTNANRPAAIDAFEPSRWSSERPEIVIPLSSAGAKPPAPEKNQPLMEGVTVRITRPPHAGKSGRVWRVAESPRSVENGLRLAGADVQLADGQVVFVPLANLELLGR